MHDESRNRTAAIVTVIAGTLLGVACAVLSPVVERSADRAAGAVETYCDNFTADQRAEFRDSVNGRLADGYGAEISCPDD